MTIITVMRYDHSVTKTITANTNTTMTTRRKVAPACAARVAKVSDAPDHRA